MEAPVDEAGAEAFDGEVHAVEEEDGEDAVVGDLIGMEGGGEPGEETGDGDHGEYGPEEPVGEDLHTMNGSAIFGVAAAEPQLPVAVGWSTGERDGVPFQLDRGVVAVAAFDGIGIDGGCGHDRTDATGDSSGSDGGGVFRPVGSAAGDGGERAVSGRDCAFVPADFGVTIIAPAYWAATEARGW